MLAKYQLNRLEVLISKALVDSSISHDEFVLIIYVLREFYDMKEEIKIPITYKNPKAVRTKNGRIMPLSECAVCASKKLEFIKEQEASKLLSSLGIKKPLHKITLLGLLLF